MSIVLMPAVEEKPEALFHPELLQQFDINGPRYTSYPSADRFHGQFGETDYLDALQRIGLSPDPVSLYFHIPFCANICYYCGCNKIITKDHARSAKYIDYLAKEIEMAFKATGSKSKISVSQLHWGGGTPTFLSHTEMSQLIGHIHQYFDLLPGGEYSIEIDPRGVTEEDIALLAKLGFNRISLGVQDFNSAVQEAIHRIQSIEETLAVMNWSRKYGFQSRSIDLIYGLPKQTPQSFKQTIDRVIEMAPERVSVYNYAHLPHIFKPQRRISAADLPSSADKLDMLSNTISQLADADYVFIGMDHFAKPDDALAIAQKERRLHRNFQGYSTQAECDLLAFGISSIGKVSDCYSQNMKTIDEYYGTIDHGHLPVLRGLKLNQDDLIRRELIGELMCQFSLDAKSFSGSHGINLPEYFAKEYQELKALEDAGLVVLNNYDINVPIKGRLLARRVAMVFDRHLRESKALGIYSKVL
jgi:oxygen-independent coproporphyrinogen-3 oxidase